VSAALLASSLPRPLRFVPRCLPPSLSLSLSLSLSRSCSRSLELPWREYINTRRRAEGTSFVRAVRRKRERLRRRIYFSCASRVRGDKMHESPQSLDVARNLPIDEPWSVTERKPEIRRRIRPGRASSRTLIYSSAPLVLAARTAERSVPPNAPGIKVPRIGSIALTSN